MRLVDIVVQSPRTIAMPLGGGSLDLPAAGTIAEAVRRCSLRYILDRAASRQCGAVMFERDGLLAHLDDVEPLPEQPFWIEAFSDGDEVVLGGEATGRRVGMMVEPDAGGLSGRMSCVAEAANGEACLIAGTIAFDLRADPAAANRPGCRIRHQDSPEINAVLARSRLLLSEQWKSYASAKGIQGGEFLKMQAELSWHAVPLVFAFNSLMRARFALTSRGSDLSRLNASRIRTGKPPLMDHIEISVNLAGGTRARTGASVDERRPPRLHFVRGHTVHRGGGSFWRSAHFRGEGGDPLVKTVAVTARGSRRSDPAGPARASI